MKEKDKNKSSRGNGVESFAAASLTPCIKGRKKRREALVLRLGVLDMDDVQGKELDGSVLMSCASGDSS